MRNKIRIFIVLASMSFLVGCGGERTRVSRENNALTAAYVVKMDKGETTPDQDRRFIHAMSKVSLELDRNIRGPKKAESTRKEAEALATGAGSLSDPMKLD